MDLISLKEAPVKLKPWPKHTIAAGRRHSVGLLSDGTVVAVGWNKDNQCAVSDWHDIVSIAVGWRRTIGLKRDGSVVSVGRNNEGECNVDGWHDMVALAAGDWHTVGLQSGMAVLNRTVFLRNFPHHGKSQQTNPCPSQVR